MSFKEYELVYGFGDIEVGMKIALDICCIGIMEGEVWQMWNLSLSKISWFVTNAAFSFGFDTISINCIDTVELDGIFLFFLTSSDIASISPTLLANLFSRDSDLRNSSVSPSVRLSVCLFVIKLSK